MPTLDRGLASNTDFGQESEGAFVDASAFGDAWMGAAHNAWARFTNITIPQGAIIDVAYITFPSNAVEVAGSVLSNIFGIDEDDHVAPTTFATWNTDHGIHTTASTVWDFTASASSLQTPSLVSVVQELVDRVGWASGNDIGIHIDDDGTASAIQQFNYGTNIVLHIEYTEAIWAQEGYRFRNDDGDEDEATWMHSQDVPPLMALANLTSPFDAGTTTPRSAGNAPTSDIFIAAHVRPNFDDQTMAVIAKFGTALSGGGPGRSCYVMIRDDGAVMFGYSADGSTVVDLASTVAWNSGAHSFPIASGQNFWLGVAHDADNGASGRTTKFYVAPTKALLLSHQLGSDVVFGSAGAIYDDTGAAQWTVGVRDDGGFHWEGGLYEIEVYSGLDFGGTRLVSPTFWDSEQGWEPGQVVSDTGTDYETNTWTIGNSYGIFAGPPHDLNPFRLRTLMNATGNPGSVPMTLQYKRFDEPDSELRTI